MGKNEPRFSFEEFVSASVGGVGLLLVILGFLLAGFGTVSNSTGNLMVTVGLILLFLATALWVVWTQPWKKFDDLQTAYYTGHDHDHDDHAEEDVEAEVVATTSEGEVPATAHTEVPIETEMVSTGSSEQSVDAGDEVESPSEPAPAPEPVAKAEPEPAPKAEKKPEAAKKEVPAVEESSEPQDLTVVEGIGPKTAQALEAEGVTTYAQLAKLSADDIEEMVKVKHKVRILSGAAQTWPKQAKYLAAGDDEGLAAYQATLKGGREVD